MFSQRKSLFESIAASHYLHIEYEACSSWSPISKQDSEPEIIHNYFTGVHGGGIPHLNQWIAPIFLRWKFEVKFAGVFCHGQPTVTPMIGQCQSTQRQSGARDCELGDMHLVFVFLDHQKNIRDQRSILFQAKKKPKPGTVAGIDNANQAFLYENSDSFDYVTMLAGEPRNLPRNKAREKALHYLFCGSPVVGTSAAVAPNLVSFGELMFRVMMDVEGLFFDLSPAVQYRRWSHINRDLLGRISGSFARGGLRGNLGNLLSRFNDFTDPTEYFFEHKEGGIPTLLIIVRDRMLE